MKKFRHMSRSNLKMINFSEVNSLAMSCVIELLEQWLPDGKIRGREYLSKNPKRFDKCLGSFSVNITTGQWCDFATGDKGGDIISLAAFLSDKSQSDAARSLVKMLRH